MEHPSIAGLRTALATQSAQNVEVSLMKLIENIKVDPSCIKDHIAATADLLCNIVALCAAQAGKGQLWHHIVQQAFLAIKLIMQECLLHVILSDDDKLRLAHVCRAIMAVCGSHILIISDLRDIITCFCQLVGSEASKYDVSAVPFHVKLSSCVEAVKTSCVRELIVPLTASAEVSQCRKLNASSIPMFLDNVLAVLATDRCCRLPVEAPVSGLPVGQPFCDHNGPTHATTVCNALLECTLVMEAANPWYFPNMNECWKAVIRLVNAGKCSDEVVLKAMKRLLQRLSLVLHLVAADTLVNSDATGCVLTSAKAAETVLRTMKYYCIQLQKLSKHISPGSCGVQLVELAASVNTIAVQATSNADKHSTLFAESISLVSQTLLQNGNVLQDAVCTLFAVPSVQLSTIEGLMEHVYNTDDSLHGWLCVQQVLRVVIRLIEMKSIVHASIIPSLLMCMVQRFDEMHAAFLHAFEAAFTEGLLCDSGTLLAFGSSEPKEAGIPVAMHACVLSVSPKQFVQLLVVFVGHAYLHNHSDALRKRLIMALLVKGMTSSKSKYSGILSRLYEIVWMILLKMLPVSFRKVSRAMLQEMLYQKSLPCKSRLYRLLSAVEELLARAGTVAQEEKHMALKKLCTVFDSLVQLQDSHKSFVIPWLEKYRTVLQCCNVRFHEPAPLRGDSNLIAGLCNLIGLMSNAEDAMIAVRVILTRHNCETLADMQGSVKLMQQTCNMPDTTASLGAPASSPVAWMKLQVLKSLVSGGLAAAITNATPSKQADMISSFQALVCSILQTKMFWAYEECIAMVLQLLRTASLPPAIAKQLVPPEARDSIHAALRKTFLMRSHEAAATTTAAAAVDPVAALRAAADYSIPGIREVSDKLQRRALLELALHATT